MRRLGFACVVAVLMYTLAPIRAQSVYPTGTTIYEPARAWSGYTVLSPLNTQAVLVIDMNGNVVKRWDGFVNSAGGPARVFPGGFVMAANGANPPIQSGNTLVLTHVNHGKPDIASATLEDDRLIEVSPAGEVVW